MADDTSVTEQIKPEHKKSEPRAPLKFRKTFTFKMAMIVIIVWVSFQITLMSIYVLFPQYDEFINRFSLSDAQALGLCAAAIAVYGVYKQEQYMWKKFGVKMNADESINTDNFQEDTLSKLMQSIEPLIKIINSVQEEIKKKNITTDDAVQTIHNLMQYEKDIKKWTTRMEKMMPIFDALAGSVENIDQKELGKIIGRRIGTFINEEIEKGDNFDVEKLKVEIINLEDLDVDVVKDGNNNAEKK